MKQRVTKIMYDTHSWVGVILGLIIYVVCFSGSIALFVNELTTWEQPAFRKVWNPEPFGIEARLQDARKQGFDYENIFIRMPTPAQPYIHFLSFHEGEQKHLRLDAHSGKALPPEKGELAHFLGELHTDLHLPAPVGTYLVGLSGIFLLVLLVTGFIIHRKRWAEMLLTRQAKTRRMWLTDVHKLLGTWSLPFIAVIAFTGGILGLLGFLGNFMALASFGGDVNAATVAFAGPGAQKSDETASMLSIDDLWSMALDQQPQMELRYIDIKAYGDAGAQVEFSGPAKRDITFQNSVVFKLASGEIIHQVNWLEGGMGSRIFGMMTPLHFASFSGSMMKWLYFVLGLGMTWLSATGIQIWLEKRLNQKRQQGNNPKLERFNRFALGVCGGLPLATAILFWTHRLLPQGLSGQIVTPISLFWLVWLGACVVAMVGPPPKRFANHLLVVIGWATLGIPVINGIMTGDFLWDSWSHQYGHVFAVDLTCLLLGLLILNWARLQRKAASKSLRYEPPQAQAA